MEYTNKGNIRGCLAEITKNWEQKLFNLYKIIVGLNDIHGKGLIHYNFHDGNILCNKYKEDTYGIYISDYSGLYQLAKSSLKESNNYGIIAYMAPEILRGQHYTQASNIYSFSMIMWEFTSGIPPFNDKAYDLQLAVNICKGKRPEIIENTPQCYVNLMKKCWDEDPSKRPTASEILNIIKKWIFCSEDNINEELKGNIMEFINAPIENNYLIVESHPEACYTSHFLDFTGEELNEILEGCSLGLKFLELKQKKDDAEQKLLNIQMELVNLQQRNSQFEQDNQSLKQDLTVQIKEFAENVNTLQTQITCLQNEKQASIKQLKQIQDQLTQSEANIQELKSQQDQTQNDYKQIEKENIKLESELFDLQQRSSKFEQNNQTLRFKLAIKTKEFAENKNALQIQITKLQEEKQALISNLTEQMEQNKLIKQQDQNQINSLNQEKIELQEELTQTKTNIRKLEFQQENLVEQKEQVEDKISQIEQEQEVTIKLKDKLEKEKAELEKEKDELEKEIAKLEQKSINEKQINMQLMETLQLKEDRINELEQKLINLDLEYIEMLKIKRKELAAINKKLINELTSGGDTKKIHKEKEAKLKELDETNQEFLKVSASYNADRKKLLFNQANNFLKAKDDYLTLRKEAIEKLQDCCNRLKSSDGVNMKDRYTNKFKNIIVKYDGLLDLNKNYDSLKNIVQKNKELEVSLAIEKILKLNPFDLDKYNIFKVVTNYQKVQLNTSMMAKDINSLRKNLDELKLELEQEQKELKNLAVD